MPQPGQKTITLPEKVYNKARRAAEKKGQSTAGFVTNLILEKTMEAV